MKLTLIVLALAATAFAQESHRPAHSGLRKTLAVAACAASAFDLGTTYAAAHNPNLREANGLFAGSGAHPKMMTISLVKVGTCGAGLYFAWRPIRGTGNAPLYTSAATVAILSAVGFHNLQVLERAK